MSPNQTNVSTVRDGAASPRRRLMFLPLESPHELCFAKDVASGRLHDFFLFGARLEMERHIQCRELEEVTVSGTRNGGYARDSGTIEGRRF